MPCPPGTPSDSEGASFRVQLAKYLKSAFLYHWNLLAFLGGSSFAVLSGQPDVFLPLVLAAEVAYLGMLGTHPRFQKFVDAQKNQAARQQASAGAANTMQRIVRGLPEKQAQRFRALRNRCLELGQIANDLRQPDQARPPQPGRSATGGARSAALDLPPPALHANHARALLPADERSQDPHRHQGPLRNGSAARPNRRTTHKSRSFARPFRTTSRPAVSGWPTSRKRAITASSSRPRSTTWKTRSAPSASSPSTARTPTSSWARSTSWPPAWSRRNGP